MSRIYRVLIFVIFFCSLMAVAAVKVSAQQPYYPRGLHGAADIVSGVYPGTDPGNCCWLGARAALRVRLPRGADTLLLNVYLPKFGAPARGQSLSVQIGSGKPQVRCCFGPGERELAFALPASAGRGRLLLHLQAGSTFVPKELGLNQDPRHLSVLLRGVAFYNSATGERFGAGPLPWLPPRLALVLLAICGALIFGLTLRRPLFGAAALMLTDPFLFAYDVHGTTVTLPKVALLAVAAGIVPKLPALRRIRVGNALWVLGAAQLLFVLSMGVSSVHAAFHGPALRETLKAVEYLATLAVAYVAYRLDPDEGAVRLTLSAVTILVSVLAFVQIFGHGVESEVIAGTTFTRIAGPLEGPNQLAGFLGIVVPAMLAFAVWRPALVLERIAIALGAAACLLTFSRSGIGALLLAASVLLLVRYRPAIGPALAAVVAAVFAGALALAFGVFTGTVHGRLESIFGSAAAFNGGLSSRVDLWHGAYALWRSHPLFGIGPGNYEIAIGKYDPGVSTHANGMYFQVLAEQGLVGLVAMLAVVAASIGAFLRRLNSPLALGACAAALAMTFHQIVDCMWIFPKVGLMWWLLLALGAAAADLSPAPERLAEAAVA